MRKPIKKGSEERVIIAHKVFKEMRGGLSALKACDKVGVNQCTLTGWLNDDPELAKEYARAREELIERIAQEVIDLSDADVGITPDGKKDWAAIQKHKLQVETRKWLLSKLAPKKYGDKLELTGDPDRPVAIEKIERIILKPNE